MNATPSDKNRAVTLDFCHEMKESTSMRQSLSESVTLAIRVEMARKGLKTSGLAAAVGESYIWLQRRFTGATPFLLNDVQRIAEALDVSLKDLLPEDVAA